MYWESQGVPTASVSLWTRMTRSIGDWEQELYGKYGKCFGIYELNRPVLYLSEPDLIRDVLVKDFHSFQNRRDYSTGADKIIEKVVSLNRDDDWKRIRTIISPTFTAGKLRKVMPLITGCMDNMDKYLDTVSKNGSSGAGSDLKLLFGAYSMEVIIQVAFGTRVDTLFDRDNPFIGNASKLFSTDFSLRLLTINMWPEMAKLLRLPLVDKSVTKFFREFTQKIIADRLSSGQQLSEITAKRTDFLQLMLDTMTATDDNDIDNNKPPMTTTNDNNTNNFDKYLTNDELIAQSIIFFIAGYETTASALSIITYLLAKHPDCQQRLYDEIDDYYRHHKQSDTDYDVLLSMKYLDAVFKESQRLYPGVSFVEREANQDYTLNNHTTGHQQRSSGGITIRKGQVVHIPVYCIHRDEANYPQADQFLPDRFLPGNQLGQHHHPYTYLPFGAGPRICIGMRLAVIEAKLALVNAVYKYRFLDTGKPLEFYDGLLGVMTPKQVFVRVEKRPEN
ncbi:cytochrome P450 3A6-like [Oppia nitens]|uniref:cytochrome P450 3A6-like n=1 Tax=Oppia nitens TaxID=1686743 RepID=UPI0023DC605C|nr:cytochrome P450 3A6-like [Oppia nitens]